MREAMTAADCVASYSAGTGKGSPVPIPAGTRVRLISGADGGKRDLWAVASVADAARLIAAPCGDDCASGRGSMAWHDAEHYYLFLPDSVPLNPLA